MKSKILLILILILSSLFSRIRAQDFEVAKVWFLGIRTIEESQLEDIIRIEAGDSFDARLIKLDKIVLTNYLRSRGFLTVEVFDSLIIRREEQEVDVYYRILEGRRYYMHEAVVRGSERLAAGDLEEVILDHMPSGEPFDEAEIEAARQRIETTYYDRGKPYVELVLDYRFEQDSLVVVTLDVSEKQTIYITETRFHGLESVRQYVLEREMEISNGDLYNRSRLSSSQRNLYGTGLFEYVQFEIEPLPDDSSHVRLNVYVQERDARWIGFRIGFAYEQELSYGNKVELTLEGGHRNLFGTGRSLSLHLVPSILYDFQTNKVVNPDNQISLVYVEPWIGYSRTPGVLQLSYHLYRPVNSADFSVSQASFRVSHEYETRYRLSGSADVKLVDVLTEGVLDTLLEEDVTKDLVYTFSLYGQRDTKNSFFNPTDGALTDLSVAFSHSIGETVEGESQNSQYFTILSSWNRYQPVSFGRFLRNTEFTLATRLRGGIIIELDKSTIVPISDRFFAGGATTVRGYQEQLLGPALLDDQGIKTTALGGKLLWLMNAELRIPLFWLFLGEIFLDGGNVWARTKDFNISDIKFTTGAGLVLLTPVGPVRLDYGYKLMTESSDPSPDAIHLGFYFAF